MLSHSFFSPLQLVFRQQLTLVTTMSEADIEKKIGLSLDELIAQQKAKQASKPKPKPKAAAAGGGKKKGGPARVRRAARASCCGEGRMLSRQC